MNEEMLIAAVNQKLQNVGAEIAMVIKMNCAVMKGEAAKRVEAKPQDTPAASKTDVKNVIVGVEPAKPTKLSKGIAETITAAIPEVSATDVIDLMPIVFGEKYKATFKDFIADFDLTKIMNPHKYYTFNAILGIYNSYTTEKVAYNSMTAACGNRDYAFDIELHQCNGKLVYSLADIASIKNNVVDEKYVEVKVPAAKKKKAKRVKSITIQEYLTKTVDTEVIRNEDWTLAKLAEDYKAVSGKKISVISIRNRFTINGISGKAVNGGKQKAIKGSLLADMIEALRGNIKIAPVAVPAAVEAAEEKQVLPVEPVVYSEKPQGLTFSMGELFDLTKLAG